MRAPPPLVFTLVAALHFGTHHPSIMLLRNGALFGETHSCADCSHIALFCALIYLHRCEHGPNQTRPGLTYRSGHLVVVWQLWRRRRWRLGPVPVNDDGCIQFDSSPLRCPRYWAALRFLCTLFDTYATRFGANHITCGLAPRQQRLKMMLAQNKKQQTCEGDELNINNKNTKGNCRTSIAQQRPVKWSNTTMKLLIFGAVFTMWKYVGCTNWTFRLSAYAYVDGLC